jgi:hypothetical protein
MPTAGYSNNLAASPFQNGCRTLFQRGFSDAMRARAYRPANDESQQLLTLRERLSTASRRPIITKKSLEDA